MPLSKEQAEAASDELLAKAHAGEVPRNRAAINWYWLIPFCAAGMAAIVSGMYEGSYLLLAGGIALIIGGAFFATRPARDENAEIGAILTAVPSAGPALLMRVTVLLVILFCLYLYLRPATPVLSPPPVDLPDCRMLGDWTASQGQSLSLYTFKADGTYVVHTDLEAPPQKSGDWLLENNRLRLWKDLGQRQARGPYDEAGISWDDDAHFKMGGSEFARLRRERAANCKN